ncbi:MAG: PAS domain S-box protein, partial [Planctomycetes bacterium]|nr:PAS domain S-box protein [Planctomycetota bacterium]
MKRRLLILILTMTTVVAGVTASTFYFLYKASMSQQREHLVETAQSWARLLESIVHHEEGDAELDDRFNISHATILNTVVDQLKQSHNRFKGFGETGEFTLAKREGDQIVFLLSHRHYDLDHPKPVPLFSERAEPMRRALLGGSGIITGLDYRGEMVLAAFEPVQAFGFGVVAKIDLAEIHAPFIHAGLLSGSIALVLIVLGTLFFRLVGLPMLQQMAFTEKRADQFSRILETSLNEIYIIDAESLHLIHANERARAQLGYSPEELSILSLWKIAPEYDRESISELLQPLR